MKDYPEEKSSHFDTMGVIFPYFWFFDVFLPDYVMLVLFTMASEKANDLSKKLEGPP
jgi:hypothetical protein